jgi:hypothetical protein
MGPPPQGGFPMGPPLQGGIRYIQLIKQPDVLKYDIVVDESTMSRDSRDRNFQMLMTVVPMALQAGVPVPPEVLDYAPLPETLRMKWKETIKKKQSEPQQPPLPLLVEQARGQNALQLEQARGQSAQQIEGIKQQAKQQGDALAAQLKDQHEKMAAAVEAQKQQAQALSENWINESRVKVEEMAARMEDQRERDRMELEASLKRMELTLQNALGIRAQNLDHEQKMEQTRISAEVAKSRAKAKP